MIKSKELKSGERADHGTGYTFAHRLSRIFLKIVPKGRRSQGRPIKKLKKWFIPIKATR